MNASNFFPLISNSFESKDSSENIAIKAKSEVQDAHFSGKQYTLHCAIIEPGEQKYVYHLSDDTGA